MIDNVKNISGQEFMCRLYEMEPHCDPSWELSVNPEISSAVSTATMGKCEKFYFIPY